MQPHVVILIIIAIFVALMPSIIGVVGVVLNSIPRTIVNEHTNYDRRNDWFLRTTWIAFVLSFASVPILPWAALTDGLFGIIVFLEIGVSFFVGLYAIFNLTIEEKPSSRFR